MSGIQLKDRWSKNSVLVLGSHETIDRLAMTNSARWYGHVLRRSLEFEVEGQMKKRKLKQTWKKQVEENSIQLGLSNEGVPCRLKWTVNVNRIATRLS